jgi:hypothetical protein
MPQSKGATMSSYSDYPIFESEVSFVELRTAARYPIMQRCFARAAKPSSPQAWQGIAYNISATGIGVALPIDLPKGTVLTIQAYSLAGACPLLVRVVHAKPVQDRWFVGCELSKRLSESDLQIWRSGPLDWLADQSVNDQVKQEIA